MDVELHPLVNRMADAQPELQSHIRRAVNSGNTQ